MQAPSGQYLYTWTTTHPETCLEETLNLQRETFSLMTALYGLNGLHPSRFRQEEWSTARRQLLFPFGGNRNYRFFQQRV